MPPPITPEEILDRAPQGRRTIRVDANVVGYFADLFWSMRQALIRKAQEPTQRKP